MSKTIDERIVEMRFDNAQFERNISTSMGTLEKLKKSLELKGATKGLEDVSRRASRGIQMDRIADSIAAVERRFSTMGIVGMRVIERLTDTALNFAGRVMGKVGDSIIGGGIRRAQNIENAHFQLQGLIKDEKEVQAVMADAMDSVDGTAYAYDEAAKAASMFAATGMQSGEKMQRSLKAITGVAAVTNSAYSDISFIFTQIAGKGRIMGEDLNQFANRGLNAAATLAKYYREVKGEVDMTEQGIRDLISGRDTNIYFEEFAEAMAWAFGDQAKKANETFTGALANIAAALARVGAKFVQPLIVQNGDFVKLFNTIRERINDINAGMNDFASYFTAFVKNVARGLTSIIGSFDMQHKIVEVMPKLYRIFSNSVTTLIRVFRILGTVIKPAIQGLQRFIPFDLLNRLGNFTAKLLQLTKNFKVSDETAGKIRKTFQGVSAVFHILGNAVKAFVSVFGDDFVNGLKAGANSLLDLGSKFGDWILGVDKAVQKNDTFVKAFEKLKELLSGINGLFTNPIQKLKEFAATSETFKSIANAVIKTRDAFKELFKVVFQDADFSGLGGLGNRFGDMLTGFINIPITLLKKLDQGFKFIAPSLYKFGGGIVDFLREVVKGFTDAFNGKGFKSVNDLINGGALTAISIAFLSFSRTIKKASAGLQKSFDQTGIFGQNGIFGRNGIFGSFGNVGYAITTTLNQTTAALQTFQKKLKVDTLKELAKALGILSASLLVLSMIDSSKLTISLGAITVLLVEMTAAMAVLNKMLSGPNNVLGDGKNGIKKSISGLIDSFSSAVTVNAKAEAMSKMMLSFSGSILMLSFALSKIASIDPQRLWQSVGAITLLIGELTAVSIALTKFNGDAKLGSGALIGFAVAIGVMTLALSGIAAIDPSRLGAALEVITDLVIELGLISVALTRFNGESKLGAAGLIGFAVAIGILVAGLDRIASIDAKRLWSSMGALSILIGLLTTASLILTNFGNIGGKAKISAVGLIAMAGAVYILSTVVEKFAAMDTASLKQGLIAVGAAMAEFVAATFLMGKADHVLASASALLIMSGALTIIGNVMQKLGGMKWEELIRGLVGMGGALAEIVIALKFMDGTAGAAASLMVVSVALTMLTGVLKGLGSMPWQAIALGLGAIAAAFTIIGVAGALLAPIVPAILGLSAAIAILGVGCIAAGAGLALFAAGLSSLAVAGVAGAKAMVEVMNILVVGAANALVEKADAILNAVTTLIQIVVKAILDNRQLLLETFLTFLLDTLTTLNQYLPQIVGVAMDLIGNLIHEIGSRLPKIDISSAIAGFINNLVQTVKDVFSKINFGSPEDIIKSIGVFALVTALMYALASVAALTPAAMVGVLAVGAVIAEMSIVLAAIGALNKIPGLQEFVESGGDLLQAVGTAIGQFVGGIIGGFASGVSSQLAQIGTDLSNFMTNVQPFIEGAKKVDASLMTGVGYLAGAIVALTAADLIAGITSFFAGGQTNFKEFGDQIAELGPGIAKFGEAVKDINPIAVEASASAAKMIAELVNTLPKEGGVLEKIFGQAQSLGQFAADLVPFGASMKAYSIVVQGVTPEAVEGSVRAAQMIADMAKTLPNSGGLSALIFGDNKLSDFAKELVPFGVAIKAYCGHIQGVTPEAVEGSVKAAQMMADMAKTLPDSGGLSALIFGDNKLSDFTSELIPFAKGMKEYSNEIAGIDNEAVTASASAAMALSELANNLPNEGGIISWFTGDNTIESFASNLKGLGAGIAAYSDSISGHVDLVAMNGTMTELKKLAELGQTLKGIDTSVYSGFAQSLRTMGENGITEFVGAFDKASSIVSSAISDMVNAAIRAITNQKSNFSNAGITAGRTICESLRLGIVNTTPSVLTTSKTTCTQIINTFKSALPIPTFQLFGSTNIINSIINGMKNRTPALLNAIRTICTQIINTFRSGLPVATFQDIGRSVIQGIINGINDPSKKAELIAACKKLCEEVMNILKENMKGFEEIGKAIDDGLAKGIKDNAAAVSKALEDVIKQAIAKEKQKLGIKSPSRVMAEDGKYMSLGLAKGISEYADRVINATESVSDSALDSMRSAIRRISSLVNSEMDVQPTIAPVVDLTNIQNGAKQMRGILTKGISTSISYNKALSASTSTKAPDEFSNPTDRTSTVSNSYNFTQNNYSPKALSRKEIYRQTKNQFSALKGAVSG